MNVNIQKVGNSVFNLLLIDQWLVGIFRTNNNVWDFLRYLGDQLDAGEPVPKDIFLFTCATTGTERPAVLERAKIVRTAIEVSGKPPKDYFLYTAIHNDEEINRVNELVEELFPQIMEALYDG